MSTEGHQSLLESYKIPSSRAVQLAKFGLEKFSHEDLKRILDCIIRRRPNKGSNEPCGPLYYQWTGIPLWAHGFLWAVTFTGIAFVLPLQGAAAMTAIVTGRIPWVWREVLSPANLIFSWARNMTAFVKAPLHLIKSSIEQKAALCVNRSGNFSLRTSGYSVMSHVWGETMGWSSLTSWGPLHISLRKKGIAYDHFLRFFDRCESEWLWVDVIAMPEVLEDMTPEQKDETETLRIGIINCLHNIYTQADQVVILDSLLLQLNTRSYVDVAVVLSLGNWKARLWPFIEARLAKKVTIKTKDFAFDLDKVLKFFDETVDDETHRYYSLFLRLMPLRQSACSSLGGISAIGIAYMGCQGRYTNVDIDAVRVLFPLLNLEWDKSFSLRDGLGKVVETFPEEEEWLKKWCFYRNLEFPVVS